MYGILAVVSILIMAALILACFLSDFGNSRAPIWFGVGLASSVVYFLIFFIIYRKYKKIPNEILCIENNILYFHSMDQQIQIAKIEYIKAKNYITRTGKLSYGKLVIFTNENEKFSFSFVENVQDVKNEILKLKT